MNIEHIPGKRRFEATLGDESAYIEYDDSEEGTLDLRHTIVPEEHEGKGIGSALARQVLDYAREKKLRVVPTCPFIASWITRNPEYQDVAGSD